jgi:hypothetical protein
MQTFADVVQSEQDTPRLDVVAPRRGVEFNLLETHSGERRLTAQNPLTGRHVTLTPYAAQAYAAAVNIPMSHWRRMRTYKNYEMDRLSLDTLRLFHRESCRNVRDGGNVMMRIHEPVVPIAPSFGGVLPHQNDSVRAILSDSYLRADNREFLDVIKRHVGQDVKIQQKISSDRHLRIKLLFNGNDDFGHGMYISNSEVGCGAREIHGFVWVKVCDNGMIISDRGGVLSNRTVHRSARQDVGILAPPTAETDAEILDQIARQIDTISSDDYFKTLTDQIDLAGDYTVNIETARKWFQSRKFAKADVDALEHRVQDEIISGNGSGDNVSVWGMAQAVTHYAHTGGIGYERQHQLERLGYDIVANSQQIAALN